VVGKVTRLRIGPERWVSEETKEGKKLLWRVDWPSIEEREEAKAARINLGIIAHVTGALSMPLGASAVPNESVQQPKTFSQRFAKLPAPTKTISHVMMRVNEFAVWDISGWSAPYRYDTAPFIAVAETQFALAVLASGCLGVIPLGDALGHG
jgi:hypothetical protein